MLLNTRHQQDQIFKCIDIQQKGKQNFYLSLPPCTKSPFDPLMSMVPCEVRRATGIIRKLTKFVESWKMPLYKAVLNFVSLPINALMRC